MMVSFRVGWEKAGKYCALSPVKLLCCPTEGIKLFKISVTLPTILKKEKKRGGGACS